MIISKMKLILITLMLLLFLSPAAVAAEEEKSDNLAMLWTMDIVKGKDKVFNDAIKSFNNIYSKKDGHFSWTWFVVESGPDTGQYIARSGGHNWADFDTMDGLWDKEMMDFWALNVGPLIENAERYITRSDDEVKHWTEGKEYKFYTLRDMHLKTGGDYYKHLKVIHETLQKNGFKEDYGLSWNVSGGRGSSATLVFPAESWADMAESSPTFAEVMKKTMSDDEFDELMEKYTSSYKVTRTTLIRALPDLSIK